MAGSYSYSPVYPISADVAALATQLAQRQSDVGTTNGGITASGGAATVPQLGVDAQNIGLAYLKGMADAIKCAVGYQGGSDGFALGSASTNSASFVDVGNTTSTGFSIYSFTAPITMTYLVHVDLMAFMSVIGGTLDFIQWQIVAGGNSFALSSMQQSFQSANVQQSISFRAPLSFTAGSPTTVKLQWKVLNGGTANVNTNSHRTFTITG